MIAVDGYGVDFSAAGVVAPAVEALATATAAVYISRTAIVAAPNSSIQNIACMINTKQYFVCVPI